MTITATDTLFLDYVRTGMIQFGRFQQPDGSFAPIACHFTLLPSFPKLLRATASALAPSFKIQTELDRFLTTRNTIALGGVLATLTDMLMLYPHGDVLNFTAAFSIEGTADVGNPTTLLTDVLTNGEIEAEMLDRSSRIGLPVKKIVSILDMRHHDTPLPFSDNVVIESLFTLHDHLETLAAQNFITPHMKATLHNWLNSP